MKTTKKTSSKNDDILVSEKDREVFFEAIFNPKQPSKALRNAVKIYTQNVKSEIK